MKINPFSKEDSILIKRAAAYVKPYKIRFLIAFICVLSGIGFGLAQPIIWAKLLTSFYVQDYGKMLAMVRYMVFFTLLTIVIGYIQTYVFSSLNQKMVFDIKRSMFSTILNLPVKAFDEIRAGEFMSRLNNDASVISNIITGQFLNSIINVFQVLIVGVAMFSISVKLSLVVVVAFPCTFLIFFVFGKIMRRKESEIAKYNDAYFSNIQQSVTGIREIKCLGLKDKMLETFILLGEKIKEKSIRVGILNGTADVFSMLVKFATDVVVIMLGFYLLTKGQLKVEMFIAFSSYAMQFSNSLMDLAKLNSNVQTALVSVGRIFELLDNLNYSVERFGDKKIEAIEGKVAFDNVHFNYRDNVKVLNGVTAVIKPNKKIAFVGGSGVGKTTLFNILLRFYNPGSGSVLIDGLRIDYYDEDSLRKHISVVQQEPFLFHMTILENLLLAKPEASQDEIVEACLKAYIHDYIVSLPLGYDTMVGEKGINFSGGQKQRIAIARAILRKSKIILFDEATSALDNESQYAVKNAVDLLVKRHTVVIIAHRLFTVIDADEIFVMDEGRIVGVGTHETLIRSNETYKRLYKTEVDVINNNRENLLIA